MLSFLTLNIDLFAGLGPINNRSSKPVAISYCDAVVIITAQLPSTTSELRLCIGSNPARGMSKIRNGEDL